MSKSSQIMDIENYPRDQPNNNEELRSRKSQKEQTLDSKYITKYLVLPSADLLQFCITSYGILRDL
jgi:hypothetical protein